MVRFGVCRHSSPLVGGFPGIREDDWCGEFHHLDQVHPSTIRSIEDPPNPPLLCIDCAKPMRDIPVPPGQQCTRAYHCDECARTYYE